MRKGEVLSIFLSADRIIYSHKRENPCNLAGGVLLPDEGSVALAKLALQNNFVLLHRALTSFFRLSSVYRIVFQKTRVKGTMNVTRKRIRKLCAEKIRLLWYNQLVGGIPDGKTNPYSGRPNETGTCCSSEEMDGAKADG